MRPDEFWQSTPREIMDLLRGAKWRERREWERVAWLAVTVIAPHVKHPPSIRKTLAWMGPEDGAIVREKAPDDIPAFLEEIAREHKKHAWALLGNEFADKPGQAEGKKEG